MQRASAIGARLAGSRASGRVSTRWGRTVAPSSANQRVAASTDRSGCSNAAPVGMHEDLVGPVGREQVTIELTAGAPLGAADQREGPRHPGHSTGGGGRPRSGPILLPVGSVPAHDHQERGDRRVGDHGIRGRGGGGQGRRRRGAPLPPAGDGRRDARRAREVARQAGRAGQARGGRRQGDRGPRERHRRPAAARRLRPGARVGRGGPRRQEGAVRRARRHREGRRHPGHQHLDPPGRRAGHGDVATRARVRHPLLQPGAGHEPRRGHRADDGERRDDRGGQGLRRPRAARTRSRSRTAPGSS